MTTLAPTSVNVTNSTVPEDIPFVHTFSYIIVGIYAVWIPLLMILVFARRNYQPVKARNPWLILLSLLCVLLANIIVNLRLAIGRQIFPCFLYCISFFVLFPFIYLPTILKCHRLFFLYKLSALRSKLDHFEQLQIELASTPSYNALPSPIDSPDELSEDPATPSQLKAREKIKRNIKILSWLASKLALIMAIAFLVVLHVALWLITTGARTGIERFNWFGTTGCGLDFTMIVVAFIPILCYVIIEVAFLIFFAFRVRDTWNIGRELIFVISLYFFASLLFAVLNIVPWYGSVGEYVVPTGWLVPLTCFIETLVSTVLPVIMSFRKGNNYNTEEHVENNSELVSVLEKDDSRNLLKKFAVQSFCPESILAWEDIQKFKGLATASARANALKKMIAKYLEVSAPLELNLPNKRVFYEEIKEALDKYLATKRKTVRVKLNETLEKMAFADTSDNLLPSTLLDRLENQVISDMMDIFARFRLSATGRKLLG